MKKILLSLSLLTIAQVYPQAAGSLDATFGTGGKVLTTVNGIARAQGMVLQSNGKIVVAGYTYSEVSGNDFLCIRYNTDGSLDNTFGNNGIATFDLQVGSDDKALAVDIDASGKIILAGYCDNGTNKDGAVIKLNTDGSLDTTFGTSGKALTDFATIDFPTRQDEFRTVKVHQLTGNIIVGGTSFTATNNSKPIFAKYTTNGSLDTTFSTDGKVTGLPNPIVGWTFLFSIEDLAVKSNGKITAVGYVKPTTGATFYHSDNYICRLGADGLLDDTFDQDGYDSFLFATSDNTAQSIILNPDDSFYFGGHHGWNNNQTNLHIGLTNATASNTDYMTYEFWENAQPRCFALAKDANGKFIFAGSITDYASGDTAFLVNRINADYSIDSNFGTGGYAATDFDGNLQNEAFDMKIQPDGKIILAGFSGNKVALARYTGVGTVGIDDFTAENAIKLYPNPATDHITLQLAQTSPDNLAYYIADVNGRIVTSGNLQASKNNTINTEQLESGVYFINLEGNAKNLKFIKN